MRKKIIVVLCLALAIVAIVRSRPANAFFAIEQQDVTEVVFTPKAEASTARVFCEDLDGNINVVEFNFWQIMTFPGGGMARAYTDFVYPAVWSRRGPGPVEVIPDGSFENSNCVNEDGDTVYIYVKADCGC